MPQAARTVCLSAGRHSAARNKLTFMFYFLLVLLYFCFFWLSSRKLLYGVLLALALLPTYLIRYTIFGFPTTVLEGLILLLFAIWFVKNGLAWKEVFYEATHFKSLKQPFNRWFLATILFLIASSIAVYTAQNSWAALGIWRAYFLEPILFFSVFISTVKSKEDLYKVVWALVLGGISIAVFAVAQKFTGVLIPNIFWQAEATRRVTSFFGYPNAVALYLAPLVPFVVYLFEHDFRKTRGLVWHDLFYFIIFALFVLSIIFARSTGGIVALAGALLILGLFSKSTRVISFLIIVFFGLSFGFAPLRESLGQEILMQGTSGQIRLNMWGETIEMLRSNWVWGAGLGNYQTVVAPYHILKWAEIYLYPHNFILNFWTEIGLPGLIAFGWLILLFFRGGLSIFNRLKGDGKFLVETLFAVMLIILIHGLVDVPYFKNDLSVFFWALLGMMVVAINLKEKGKI